MIGLNKNEEMFTEYQYGFHDRDVSIFKTEKGLTKEIVETISKRKQEPGQPQPFEACSDVR